jgi:hypothetical protein
LARLYCNGTLIVDDWQPLQGVPAPDWVPPEWQGPHVLTRYSDGLRTLFKQPLGRCLPSTMSNCWPAYRKEFDDLIAMIGGEEFQEYMAERNRSRELPSAREISEMDLVLSWPGMYLDHDDRDHCHSFLLICHARALGIDTDDLLEKRSRLSPHAARRLAEDSADRIADALNDAEVATF